MAPAAGESAEEDEPESDPLSGTEELPSSAGEERTENSIALQERFSPENLWKKLVDHVAGKRFSLSEIMQSGFPDRIENRTLFVAFDEKAQKQDKELLEEAGTFLRNELCFVTGDREASLAFVLRKGLMSEEKPRKQLEELKKEAAENPMVREAKELFAGVIVDVFE